MKTIGDIIKNARLKKRLSLARLEDETKIKKSFLSAIEDGDWGNLPEFPVLTGFVKRLAYELGVNERNAVALLRRDYPPKKIQSLSPKPDIPTRLIFGPKITFLFEIVVIVFLVFGYLFYQYSRFVAPPALDVFEPKEDQIVSGREVTVSGKTDTDSIVKINNQPVLIDQDGNFSAKVQIFEGTSEIVVSATSRAGRETEVRRRIKPELE